MLNEPQKNKQTEPRAGVAVLVGLFSWLIPGFGYFLLGQRGRAIIVFSGIFSLFMCGIAIGGIRIMDPPGWDEYGYQSQIIWRSGHNQTATQQRFNPKDSDEAAHVTGGTDQAVGPALLEQPMAEIADKPWYVLQILCGPITLMCSDISVSNAHPALDKDGNKIQTPEGFAETVPMSHSRSWEIGALYTAVAGMLNLLAIIDAVFIAVQPKSTEPQLEKAMVKEA
jgi:TM2 domain-containing membrane protein YozV